VKGKEKIRGKVLGRGYKEEELTLNVFSERERRLEEQHVSEKYSPATEAVPIRTSGTRKGTKPETN